jgi:hypothetical protein
MWCHSNRLKGADPTDYRVGEPASEQKFVVVEERDGYYPRYLHADGGYTPFWGSARRFDSAAASSSHVAPTNWTARVELMTFAV